MLEFIVTEIEKLKARIINLLIPIRPYKIILFGSYAYGTPTKDSDIDIYVVTNDDFIPQNFKEKSEVYLKVARAMQEFLKEYPTDIITHTRKMYEKFKESNSSFAREILQKGIEIYG